MLKRRCLALLLVRSFASANVPLRTNSSKAPASRTARLADRGLLETSWEPGVGSRPPRHLYRLSGDGREFVAALTAAHLDGTATPPRRQDRRSPLTAVVRGVRGGRRP